ncbi:MAG: hypothetical protein MAG431_02253 [Chloroflexi bacterium]|nr:hypothetical protein [Chloroflexota bacterium]
MNHQPYETWILLETKLDAEQEREYYQHLRTCSQCRRLAQAQREIEHLFATSPAPYPQPGFTSRWKERLAKVEEGRKNFATWIMLSVLTLAFLFTLVGLSLQIISRAEYFPQLIAVAISQAARWFNLLTSLENFFSPVLRVGIKLIPQSWILAFIFSLSGIVTTWVITLSKNSISFNKEVTG